AGPGASGRSRAAWWRQGAASSCAGASPSPRPELSSAAPEVLAQTSHEVAHPRGVDARGMGPVVQARPPVLTGRARVPRCQMDVEVGNSVAEHKAVHVLGSRRLLEGARQAAGSRRCGPYTPNRHAVEAATGLDGGATGGRDVVLLRLLALVRVLEEAAHPHLRDAAGFFRRGRRPGRRPPPLDLRRSP